MEIKYLFKFESKSVRNNTRDEIDDICRKYYAIDIKTSFLKNEKLCIVTVSTKHDQPDQSDNDLIAKNLSDIDVEIHAKYNPIVLSHGTSIYFDSILYPIFSNVERELREFLSLIKSIQPISNNQEEKQLFKKLTDLDQFTLEKLFKILFVDGEYRDSLTKYIENNCNHFCANEFNTYLGSINESIPWDNIVGKNKVQSLRNNFNKFREYRNDIMHAHYISFENYSDAKEIAENILKELNEEILKLSSNRISHINDYPLEQNLNTLLENEANAVQAIKSISDTFSEISSITKNATSPITTAFANMSKTLAEPGREMKELQNNLKQFSKSVIQQTHADLSIESSELISKDSKNTQNDEEVNEPLAKTQTNSTKNEQTTSDSS